MVGTDFYLKIKTALNEKDVENTYRNIMGQYFQENIESPYGTDGVIKTTVKYDDVQRKLLLIMEFKYDEDFTKSISVSKVLIQVLYYLKKFEEDGKTSPNVTFIGDKNESFVLHTNPILKYLDEDINWSLPPSSASKSNTELIQKINNDPEINPFIFSINKDFNFNEVVDKIKNLATNTHRLVRITEKNIPTIYEHFITKVIIDYKDYDANDLVSIFISLVLDKEASYLHPNKPNTIVINDNRHIKGNKKAYIAFFSHFQQEYKPIERRKFTEISDRLIEETNRRGKGEYYTPPSFVKYAHSRLDKVLKKNWRSNYVVWDSAWGTGNLTRDYSFENLYASTINDTDLNMGSQYNQRNEKFEYDFLNEDVETFSGMALIHMDSMLSDDELYKKYVNMPKELFMHLSNPKQPILFLINPPYKTGGTANAQDVESTLDLGNSAVGNAMRDEKMKVSEQLYAQFLYRILKMKRNLNLENVYIGLFSPSLFLTGQKYKTFRKEFLKDFLFCDGSIFKASHFADVKGNWAIDFSVWKTKDSFSKNELTTEFKHNVLSLNDIGEVEVTGEKMLWNLDKEKTLQEWLINPTEKGILLKNQLCFTSSFKTNGKIKKVRSDALGFFINDTNNIEATTKGCYLMSSKITRNIRTITIIPENFPQIMVAFTGRNLYRANWINQKDEFSAPDVNHKSYKVFEVLSVVHSIFSIKNNIISYRNLKENGKSYYGDNPWFFMSNESIQKLANNSNNNEAYNDSISNAGERFVYEYLKENKQFLTEQAKELIILAKNIIEKTFPFRNDFDLDNNEDKFLNTWDASWTQIRLLAKAYDESSLIAFNKKFKEFEFNLLEIAEDLKFLKYS